MSAPTDRPYLLLINDEVVGEMRYGPPEQPRFVGDFSPVHAFTAYEQLFATILGSESSSSHEQSLEARSKIERFKLQVRSPLGRLKTLNGTLLCIRNDRFAHRMCAEDLIRVYRHDLLSCLKGDSRLSNLLPSLRMILRLKFELFRNEIQRRRNTDSRKP